MKTGHGRGAALHSFASNSSLDSLEYTQLSGDSELGISTMEPNIKKYVRLLKKHEINWNNGTKWYFPIKPAMLFL